MESCRLCSLKFAQEPSFLSKKARLLLPGVQSNLPWNLHFLSKKKLVSNLLESGQIF